MRTRRITFGAEVAVTALAAAACGDDGGGGAGQAAALEGASCAPITDGSAEGEELSVWIMEGTNPDAKPYFKALGMFATGRGFVAAVPKEIEEAASVDGASWFRMFWSVLMPLVAPGLVAVSVFSFITAWNEFVFAFTLLNEDNRSTAAIGLRQFFTERGTDWGAVMAGSTLITLPVMLFFIVIQRRISSGWSLAE